MNRDLFRLEHIRECADKIELLVERLETFENFEQRWVEQDSMLRNLEIIGEASNHISNTTKEEILKWGSLQSQ